MSLFLTPLGCSVVAELSVYIATYECTDRHEELSEIYQKQFRHVTTEEVRTQHSAPWSKQTKVSF